MHNEYQTACPGNSKRSLLAKAGKVIAIVLLGISSQQALAHIEYYDLNQGAQISDLTAAGQTASTAQYGLNPNVDMSPVGTSLVQTSDRPINNTAYWNATYQQYTGVGSFSNVTYGAQSSSANVTVNDVTAFGWGNGTLATLGDTHKVDFFDFRLAQAATVTITWNIHNSAGNYFDSGFSLYSGVMNYQSHDDAQDPLNPSDPNTFNAVQDPLDTGKVKDAQGIASAFRDTVTNAAPYVGQFNALGNWGDANASGQWSNLQYITSVNSAIVNSTGFSISTTGWKESLSINLGPGNYTIAAAGATGALGSGTTSRNITNLTGNLTFNAVSAVPVPGAFWLFGTAIAGMVGFGRRKSVAHI